MKEGGGGDHVSVGVRKPRSKRIRTISKRDIFVRPPSKWNLFFVSCAKAALECLNCKQYFYFWSSFTIALAVDFRHHHALNFAINY